MTASASTRPALRPLVRAALPSLVDGRLGRLAAAAAIAVMATAAAAGVPAAVAAVLVAGPAVGLRLLADRWGSDDEDPELLRVVHGLPRALAEGLPGSPN